MQRLEVSCAVRRFIRSLGFKGLMNLEFISTDIQEHLNIKFHENQSSVSRGVPCGRTDGATGEQPDRQT